jgi:homoserine/homoserine lactone efflux protein
MIPDNIATFVVLTTLVSLMPGPNTMFVMSQAALRGPRAGIMAGLGIEMANVAYFALTALGLASVIAASAMTFDILKWGGAAYLAGFGLYTFIRSFRKELGTEHLEPAHVPGNKHHGALIDGLMIGLGNPKTIIYFVALLPQFIDSRHDVIGQTITVGVIGTMIDVAAQWLYSHLGGALSRFLSKPNIRRWFERGLGGVFMTLSAMAAFYRRAA